VKAPGFIHPLNPSREILASSLCFRMGHSVCRLRRGHHVIAIAAQEASYPHSRGNLSPKTVRGWRRLALFTTFFWHYSAVKTPMEGGGPDCLKKRPRYEACCSRRRFHSLSSSASMLHLVAGNVCSKTTRTE
jgi:hypothetical protein